MGAVWRATDELLGRTVAIKRLRLEGSAAVGGGVARERTMREAELATIADSWLETASEP
jgi:eukaryotic-like serine/threonine-protein kinase